MTYKIYLREGNDCRLVAEANGEMLPIPNRGELWPLVLDEQEILCEIEEVGDLRLGLDGRTILSQDIFVHKLAADQLSNSG